MSTQNILRDIFDALDEAVLILDPTYTVRLANRAFCRLFKTTEAETVGSLVFELSNRSWDIEKLRLLLSDVLPKHGMVDQFIVTHDFPTIGKRTMSLNAREVISEAERSMILVAIHDVTDEEETKRQLQVVEKKLIAAQRLESIALLAGGIAHDFNNVLGVIIGFADLGLRRVGTTHPLSENLSRIYEAAQRGAQISRQLLAFSRRQILAPQDVNLNDLIKDLLKLLGKTLGEHIEMQFIPEAQLHTVHADPVQVEQVIMNLCINARDAMPEGGKLIIETMNIYLDEQYTDTHPTVKSGHYTVLTITDTGHGMSEEVKNKVFEPFFTTKEPGKGTGLGLSVVHGIVAQHNGFINLYSEIGKGTTFKIYFPSVDRPAVARTQLRREQIVGGTETILLVEDEQAMRDMIKATLENLGYTVLATENGEQALQQFPEHRDAVKLVISDIVMPKMGGKQLYESLQAMSYTGTFLFISGYTTNVIHNNFISKIDAEALMKPFTASDLGNKVRKLLDEARK